MGQAYGIYKMRSRRIHQAEKKHDDDDATQEERVEVREAEEPRCTQAKCRACCKSFAAFLFSTIGLVLMVVAYSIAGGFLFQSIEQNHEKENIHAGRYYVGNRTEHHIQKLWDITLKLNILAHDNWTAEAKNVFIDYQKDIYNATVANNWDGQNATANVTTKWNFAGALLYAVTGITTIGYGHVTPKTPLGMGSTIIYCLVGIPLTLMCIANLGKFFARVFRILYHTCCCGICCICCLSYKKKRFAKKMTKTINGNGGNVDLQVLGNGEPLTITNDPLANGKKRKSRSNLALSKAQVWMLNVKKKFARSLRDDVTVPVYLCLVVMGLYVMLGALLFSLWDGWGYLEGAYFCFVTLTTIGFGDYVPGIVADDPGTTEGTEKLVLCSLYVFMGLALIGMCIDLMQADVLQKLRWIARKIGVMSDAKKKDTELNVLLQQRDVEHENATASASKPRKEEANVFSESIEYEHEVKFIKEKRKKTKASKETVKPNKQSNKSASQQPVEELLCLPPPAYAEFDDQPTPASSAAPDTPASHYDDLPTHISSMTPLHKRLNDVKEQTEDVEIQSKCEADNISKNGTARVLRSNSRANDVVLEMVLEDSNMLENGDGCVSVQLKDGADGEEMLLVSKPSDSGN